MFVISSDASVLVLRLSLVNLVADVCDTVVHMTCYAATVSQRTAIIAIVEVPFDAAQ